MTEATIATQAATPAPSAPAKADAPTAAPPAATTATAPAVATAAPAAPSAGTGATLATSDIPEDAPTQTPSNFPSNWRQVMAGGDAKIEAYLNRYASPNNVTKALVAMRSKMDAGEIVRSKPDGTDPVALNEWRAQAGVPDAPDGYLEKVPGGLVFGETDKPMLSGFLKEMHEADAPPAYVHKALNWYKQTEEKLLNDRADADKAFRATSEDELRAEWGPEYRANLNAMKGLLTTHGSDEVAAKLFSARSADGRPLGDDPAVLKFLVGLSREINPQGTVTPAPGQNVSQTIEAEIAQLEKEQADTKGKQHDYYRNEGKQARYRELIGMRERVKGRAA